MPKSSYLILSKDLSFVPIAGDVNHFELLRDFNKFVNRIRQLLRPQQYKLRETLKRVKNYDSKQTYFYSAKLEGVFKLG